MRSGRRIAAAATAAVLLLGLAACSSTASDATPTASSTGAGSGAFPATVATKFGAVTVAEKPEKVVALGWGDAETALALGVQPVGASDWLAFGGEGVGPWADGLYEKKPTSIGTLEPSYEQIAALKPDLILDTKSAGDKARYTKLSAIAPTVDVPKGGDAYATTMQQQVTMIATALGEKAKGAALLAEVDTAFSDAAAKYGEFDGKTVTVASYTSEGWGAYTQSDSRVKFMEKLGFTQNPAVQKLDTGSFSASISSEKLDLLDSDVLIVLPIGVSESDVTSQAVYKALPVVKAGHAIVLGSDIGNAFSDNTTLSTTYAIDHVAPLVAKALAK